MRKLNLMMSVALVAITTPAWAQTTAPQADDTTTAGAGDIIVTATRRSEALSGREWAVDRQTTRRIIIIIIIILLKTKRKNITLANEQQQRW